MNDSLTDFIVSNNFLYYFRNTINDLKYEKVSVGLEYYQDLNIFILKTKDIFLIYTTLHKYYCENGYFYNIFKCVKYLRKCKR